jgi:diguanylate cyclase (GGDEF)-like protein
MDGRVAEPFPDYPELIELIDSLSDALESHYDWLWATQRVVVCNDHGSTPVCHLDDWLQMARDFPLEVNGAVGQVADRHRVMHETAAALLHAREGGCVPTTAYDAFLNARKAFKDAALQLERALWNSTCLVDALTGLRNRNGMLLDLREEQQRALRDRRSCTLAMMDIDHFKAINDGHGHLGGDAVLRAVARLVSRRLRPYDRIYRFGGEEFLLCLPDTEPVGAAAIMDRVREEIAREYLPAGAAHLHVTVSFGVAPLELHRPVKESIARADTALYLAKAQGRNRVVAAGA